MTELQWQRQSALWLQLAGFDNHRAGTLSLQVNRGTETYYIELQKNNRVLLALSREVEFRQLQLLLLKLLSFIHPSVCNGVAVRAWIADRRLWVATVAPEESGAETWVNITRLQSRILKRVAEN